MRIYKNTIIVGAGISGLACAKRLTEHNQDFIVISPDIGGRIQQSKDKKTQYGSYYIMKNYINVKNIVEIKRRINPLKVIFNCNDKSYSILNIKLLLKPLQLLRLLILLNKFLKHYEIFKVNCLNKPQSECLRKEPYLFNLYNTNAYNFVKGKKITQLSKEYLTGVIQGSTFTKIEDINAFTLLHLSLPLIVPIYEFSFNKESIVNLLSKNLVIDEVKSIHKDGERYLINTKNNKEFESKNIVFATPPNITKELLNLNIVLKKPVASHMYHIEGEINTKNILGHINLFNYNSDILAIAKQIDNSYLVYTKKEDINLENYFKRYKIIEHIYWNPAFNIRGSEILDFRQGDNVFVIGDHNICCMEDCYIYGVFAANYIKNPIK